MKRIGILTGGGDCPGLNAAIRAVVRKAVGVHGFEVLGFRDGWRGVMDGDVRELTADGFPRFGGIAQRLAPDIERGTGYETRVTLLGHVQRGGSPVAEDRILATRFGVAAIDLAARDEWGKMVGVRGSDVVEVPLAEAAKVRPVPEELYRVAEMLFDH